MDVLEALFAEQHALREYLIEQGQPTFVAELERTYPKVLLIAAASYFETELVRILDEHFGARSDGDPLVLAFIRNKAFKRQYHTFFDWDSGKANTFWALFGPDFKTYALELVNADAGLAEAATRFVEVGRLRNQLVHDNFIVWPLDLTAEDVIDIARAGYGFLERLPEVLEGF